MLRLRLRREDFEESFARSSGPGGQHVNKVSTAVTLRHGPTGTAVTVQDSRSQAMNRQLAWMRLLDAIESQRQQALVKKAKLCDAKLLILVTAFTKLLRDEHFLNLLRAEKLSTVPKFLADKLQGTFKEAA